MLSGPVVAGIKETLIDNPEDMAIKNQGIYLLVEDATFRRTGGGCGQLTITMTHPDKHGIVNGGHTYAAIRDAINNAEEMDLQNISRAYVRLHILQGIEGPKVAEIAEGLNRSKQVDDPSLANLQGHFDKIREVMAGRPGESSIAYHQGSSGDIYVAEILVFIEMFNRERFDRKKHPHYLYNRTKSALEFYRKDLESQPSPLDIVVPKLPEILELSDLIQQETPAAAKRASFEFGRMGKGKNRAASKNNQSIPLPFLGTTTKYRVPKGWLYPMLAAFSANVSWDLRLQKFEWKVPLKKKAPGNPR